MLFQTHFILKVRLLRKARATTFIRLIRRALKENGDTLGRVSKKLDICCVLKRLKMDYEIRTR